MIPATIELNSKVRYGMTARGVPLFRAIPYDSKLQPMITGCSLHDTSQPVVGIFAPPSNEPYQPGGSYPRGTLLQILGPSGDVNVETQALLYQYGGTRPKRTVYDPPPLPPPTGQRFHIGAPWFTFHIDPPGCRDVDDVFSFQRLSDTTWRVAITIADAAYFVTPDTMVDTYAKLLGSTFYSLLGEAITPMLPRTISEEKASLHPRRSDEPPPPGLSLFFTWDTETNTQSNLEWLRTTIDVNQTFTYITAMNNYIEKRTEFLLLSSIAKAFAAARGLPFTDDSHSWVEQMMLFYNAEAGKLLRANSTGILRRHSLSDETMIQTLAAIGAPIWLAFRAAEYCLSTDPDTTHTTLFSQFYAHASSPLRRYVDLLNQRAIHAILDSAQPPPFTQELIDLMNARAKAQKSFSRDLHFLHIILSNRQQTTVEALVVSDKKVFVPSWNRLVRVKGLGVFPPGSHISLGWYVNPAAPNWKQRFVFQLPSVAEGLAPQDHMDSPAENPTLLPPGTTY
jgi:exoribonuclease R